MPDLARDLDRVAAGTLSGVVLTAAELDHVLTLTVAIERARAGLCWALHITGGPPGIAGTLRLGIAGLAAVRAAVSRAIETGAARGWRVPARDPILLADVGEVGVGVGLAGATLWAVLMVGTATLRLPAADLARLRDALLTAEARMTLASGSAVH